MPPPDRINPRTAAAITSTMTINTRLIEVSPEVSQSLRHPALLLKRTQAGSGSCNCCLGQVESLIGLRKELRAEDCSPARNKTPNRRAIRNYRLELPAQSELHYASSFGFAERLLG